MVRHRPVPGHRARRPPRPPLQPLPAPDLQGQPVVAVPQRGHVEHAVGPVVPHRRHRPRRQGPVRQPQRPPWLLVREPHLPLLHQGRRLARVLAPVRPPRLPQQVRLP